ncbi:hypothetical protein DFA_07936 [Cavenderia fasciculata]|uniref:Alpha-mannosidase n=1 Tax=Cavenderia fasciculata TaxID=261658 RepID=F4Q441_CACFS|nr:uncharacterized protein DFA_07936 [Cavenderia fasciculata]EGG16955.1 hypothetical protein DFA_07936 [Cavenderia fasciculata]|eukprot:XP_004355429.1 hypothetical protein DFA_07936 [Cavenderia fasciculata]
MNKRKFLGLLLIIQLTLLLLFGQVTYGAFGSSDSSNYQDYDESKLYVMWVEHSHCDLGWLSTVEEYYDTQVQNILDRILDHLTDDSSKRFIWSEIGYLEMWWNVQSLERRSQFKQLVDNGQLEIIGGGWVMNDEALPVTVDVLDQITEGHQWVLKNLNTTVRHGWQIDPFGHSSQTASLYPALGFQSFVAARLSDTLKASMRETQELQFVWEGSPSLNNSRLFVNTLYKAYGYSGGPKYPDEIDYDDFVSEIQIYRDRFADGLRTIADAYRTNVILVTFGDDFAYQSDQDFTKGDYLIDQLNEHFDDMVVTRSTLTEYYNFLQFAMKTKQSTVPLFKKDFFPYITESSNPWTGFYTSRPIAKRQIREISSLIRSTDFIYSIASAKAATMSQDIATNFYNLFPSIQFARRMLAITQHHDAVTGTARSYVMYDYLLKLTSARQMCNDIMSKSMELLLLSNANDGVIDATNNVIDQDQENNLFNLQQTIVIDSLKTLKRNDSYSVVIFNSLGWIRKEIVSIRVNCSETSLLNRLVIADENGVSQTLQIVPIVLQRRCIRDQPTSQYSVYFTANVKPLGISTYFISLASSPIQPLVYDPSNVQPIHRNRQTQPLTLSNQLNNIEFNSKGIMKSIQKNNNSFINITNSLSQYSTTESGAYIFVADSDPKKVIFGNHHNDDDEKIKVFKITGHLFDSIVHYQYLEEDQDDNDDCLPTSTQYVRLYKDTNQTDKDLIELGYRVKGEPNKETVIDLETSLINQQYKYFMDNGMESRVRHCCDESVPIGQRYYPLINSIDIKDRQLQFTVFSDRSLGSTVPRLGEIEVMIHRNLQQDDYRGLGFAQKDSTTVDGKLFINFDSIQNSLQIQKKLSTIINSPLVIGMKRIKSVEKYKLEYSTSLGLFNSDDDELPLNLHLMTLKYHDDVTEFSSTSLPTLHLRVQHLFAASQDPTYSLPIQLSSSNIFNNSLLTVSNVHETLLDGIDLDTHQTLGHPSSLSLDDIVIDGEFSLSHKCSGESEFNPGTHYISFKKINTINNNDLLSNSSQSFNNSNNNNNNNNIGDVGDVGGYDIKLGPLQIKNYKLQLQFNHNLQQQQEQQEQSPLTIFNQPPSHFNISIYYTYDFSLTPLDTSHLEDKGKFFHPFMLPKYVGPLFFAVCVCVSAAIIVYKKKDALKNKQVGYIELNQINTHND